MTIDINPTAQAIVDITEYPPICSLASVRPKDLLTTQKNESLKYEKNREPTQAESVANTGLTPKGIIIGAAIDAAVSMATVPEPWINLIIVAMINGSKSGLIFKVAM